MMNTSEKIQKGKKMSKFHRTNYRQAIDLLRDDKLVWSSDMDSIRKIIADALQEQMDIIGFENTNLNYLAEKLIEEENDLSI